MGEEHLTQVAKARLFDSLMTHEDLLVEALTRLAAEKASALIIIHKSGLKPNGRSLTQQDFGLDRISSAIEILTGEPLGVNALVRQQRLQLDSDLAGAGSEHDAVGQAA